jgi:OOP family OmpA-OmpF porin
MKNLIGIFMAVCTLVLTASAQEHPDKDKYKKGRTISVHYTLHDFQTAADLRQYGLSQVLLDKQWYKTSRMKGGFAISDTRGITPNIDLMYRLGITSMEYPVPGKNTAGDKNLYLESDLNLNFKLLTDNYMFSPYISVGAGASKWGGYYGAYAPVGLGIQGHFGKLWVFLQSQYRFSITANVASHIFWGMGLGMSLPGKKAAVVVAAPPPPPVVRDTDGDGIVDSLDACPTVAGLAQFQGCPDTDKDGIKDSEDKCPTVPGLAKYNGCPIPDTDGDGINDEEDKCPTIAGLARYNGCPIPDTDGDGINDEEDKCPTVAGTAANFGCPDLVVYYKRNESKLDANDKVQLDKVASFLSAHGGFNVVVEGHTSTLGDAKYNQKLSEKRAAESVKYLITKGVDPARLKPVGFGEQFPIGDNSKEEGRALSRRVVIRVQQ